MKAIEMTLSKFWPHLLAMQMLAIFLQFNMLYIYIYRKHTESIKLLAPFCHDYFYHGRLSLIIWAIIFGHANVELIKILGPPMKDPNAPDEYGRTPIQMATRYYLGL